MKIIDNVTEVQNILMDRFSKKRKSVQKNLGLITLALIKSQNCSLPEIAMQMSSLNNKTLGSNELRVSRFLQSKEFQIDDQLWRSHIKLIFDLLEERGFFNSLKNNKGKIDCNNDYNKIVINVDFTTSNDNFNILSASIPFDGRGIPLYFSTRNYPKRKGQFNQMKMEESFIKELKHLLSNKYKYVIVADRGFGNSRFANLCKNNGFDYLLRVKEDLRVDYQDKIQRIKDIKETDGSFPNIEIVPWQRSERLVRSSYKKMTWSMVTSIKRIPYTDVVRQYGKRFKCEKMFQDQKSSGFNIEKSKIRKYDRFKKLLYLVTLAQILMMFIGDYINDNVDEIKKKYPLHLKLISAFSN